MKYCVLLFSSASPVCFHHELQPAAPTPTPCWSPSPPGSVGTARPASLRWPALLCSVRWRCWRPPAPCPPAAPSAPPGCDSALGTQQWTPPSPPSPPPPSASAAPPRQETDPWPHGEALCCPPPPWTHRPPAGWRGSGRSLRSPWWRSQGLQGRWVLTGQGQNWATRGSSCQSAWWAAGDHITRMIRWVLFHVIQTWTIINEELFSGNNINSGWFRCCTDYSEAGPMSSCSLSDWCWLISSFWCCCSLFMWFVVLSRHCLTSWRHVYSCESWLGFPCWKTLCIFTVMGWETNDSSAVNIFKHTPVISVTVSVSLFRWTWSHFISAVYCMMTINSLIWSHILSSSAETFSSDNICPQFHSCSDIWERNLIFRLNFSYRTEPNI